MEWLQDFAAWLRQLWVLWLMLVFVGIVAWVYWPRRKDRLEKHGRIPLEDDKPSDQSGEK